MIWLCLSLIAVSFSIALPATAAVRRLGHRLGALDGAGVAGQVKAAPRKVPNTGGVAIYLGVILPMLLGVAYLFTAAANPADDWLVRLLRPYAPGFETYLPGMRQQAPAALMLIGALTLLHAMGLLDDRRPLGATPKLLVMLGVASLLAWTTDSRLLTMLDAHVGGSWLSIVLTVLWIGVVTNAFNFLDNMDGLSAGVAAIAASFFLAGTLASPEPQWFIAACLALLIGALLGFLWFNYPLSGPATIFMGDGGSLVVGFLMAFLTVRTTYAPIQHWSLAPGDWSPATHTTGAWYGIFMPLIVLAIPLYDFTSVTIIRLRQGKSPFVGDLQHFSHRLVRRGLSRRAAVAVILGCTAVTAIGGVSLASLQAWQAILVGVQTILVLLVLALYEWSASSRSEPATTRPDARPGAGMTQSLSRKVDP